MQILPFDKSDLTSKEIHDFVMNIKVNDLGRKAEATDLINIPQEYLKNGNFWVTLENAKLVGTIGLKNIGRQGHLKRMYISKELRGIGLAQKLLETLIKYAREQNIKEIFLGTDTAAERAMGFYEKMGFKKINSLPANFDYYLDTIFYKLEI